MEFLGLWNALLETVESVLRANNKYPEDVILKPSEIMEGLEVFLPNVKIKKHNVINALTYFRNELISEKGFSEDVNIVNELLVIIKN